jgi:hypothetical protein
MQVDRLGVLLLKGKAPYAVPADEAPGVPRLYGRAYAEVTVKASATGSAASSASARLTARQKTEVQHAPGVS